MSGGDWKQMFKGIQQNDFELVKFYLNTGIDPNYQHPEYLALPIAESIRYKHLDITKLLLQNGADPSIRELESGGSTLDLAKKLNYQEGVDLINEFLST